MGMTSFKGKRPTLTEAKIVKNYLNEDELDTLNHLVSAYLDLAELQALRRKPMYMKDWIARLDDYLHMTDSEVLQNAGKVSHALAEQKAKEEYQKFKQMQSMELTPVEEAFVASIETSKVDELSEGVKKLKSNPCDVTYQCADTDGAVSEKTATKRRKI